MLDQKDFLGRGWAFPVQLDPITGAVATAQAEDDVQQAIHIILGTVPGERVMHPDFGCGIHEMVFTVIDASAMTRIASMVRAQLTRYEARVELTEVSVDPFRAAEGRLDVTVAYRIRRTNQLGNLVYPFYFREGGAL
jgi:phage baseplate assembly protein W